jgi:hypothetical protein
MQQTVSESVQIPVTAGLGPQLQPLSTRCEALLLPTNRTLLAPEPKVVGSNPTWRAKRTGGIDCRSAGWTEYGHGLTWVLCSTGFAGVAARAYGNLALKARPCPLTASSSPTT